MVEATPKLVMRLMAVPGLTLYHLKSHLQVFDYHFSLPLLPLSGNSDMKIALSLSSQKYRLAKNRDPSTVNDDKKTSNFLFSFSDLKFASVRYFYLITSIKCYVIGMADDELKDTDDKSQPQFNE